MRKFYQNKLWRDKLIKARESQGAIVHSIRLSDGEYGEEIKIKLLEEANEIYAADTQAEMVNEIVDVLEVIDSMLKLYCISQEEIAALKAKKLAEQGSYNDRRLIDYVEYPEGSPEEKHCLENQEKYPELDDEGNEKHPELDDNSNEKDDETNNCCK